MTARRRLVLGAAPCATAVPSLTACSTSADEQDAARALRCVSPAVSPAVSPVARKSPSGEAAAIKHELCATPRWHRPATTPNASPLFRAVTERQCTRGDYDGQALTAGELKLLEAASTGRGVSVRLLTARPAIESVLDFVVAGNTAQMSDPAFVTELKSWIRFGADEALRTGDGLFAGASGSPALPRWLGSRMMGLCFTPKSENERYVRQIRNSAGLAVFVSERNVPARWVEAGRCYERFALQATALGIRNAFLNQPVEGGAIRPQFGAWLGLAPNERPDLVVRFGRGPAMPLSMRRPVQSVLI